MFSGLGSLETLILSRNPITFISPFSFSAMTSLRELTLNKGKLGHVTTSKLGHVKAGAFDGLVSLRSMTLNDNVIGELPDKLFAGLRSLRKVHTYLLTYLLDFGTFQMVISLIRSTSCLVLVGFTRSGIERRYFRLDQIQDGG